MPSAFLTSIQTTIARGSVTFYTAENVGRCLLFQTLPDQYAITGKSVVGSGLVCGGDTIVVVDSSIYQGRHVAGRSRLADDRQPSRRLRNQASRHCTNWVFPHAVARGQHLLGASLARWQPSRGPHVACHSSSLRGPPGMLCHSRIWPSWLPRGRSRLRLCTRRVGNGFITAAACRLFQGTHPGRDFGPTVISDRVIPLRNCRRH